MTPMMSEDEIERALKQAGMDLFQSEPGSEEEASRAQEFVSLAANLGKQQPYPALKAVSYVTGHARSKKRENIRRLGCESLNELARIQLDMVKRNGIKDGAREIEETCGFLRNILLHYGEDDGLQIFEAREIFGKLLVEWVTQFPADESLKKYTERNFDFNSRDLDQSWYASNIRNHVSVHSPSTEERLMKKIFAAPEGSKEEQDYLKEYWRCVMDCTERCPGAGMVDSKLLCFRAKDRGRKVALNAGIDMIIEEYRIYRQKAKELKKQRTGKHLDTTYPIDPLRHVITYFAEPGGAQQAKAIEAFSDAIILDRRARPYAYSLFFRKDDFYLNEKLGDMRGIRKKILNELRPTRRIARRVHSMLGKSAASSVCSTYG